MSRTTRICIKCNKELPIGMFDDTWRHKVNICKDCDRVYRREYYRKSRAAKGFEVGTSRNKQLKGKVELLTLQLKREREKNA